MVAPEIQPIRNLVEPAVQAQLRDDGAVRVMVALLHRRPAQDLGPHNAVVVVATADEQQAPEALRRPRRRRVERVLERLGHGARVVDLCRPGVGEHDVRVLVERVDAALQQVAGVQVIVRRPLEQFAPRLLGDEVVVGGEPDVPRLAEIAYPGVLLLVASADVTGAVGRGVVRNYQLEIREALAEQGLERLGDVFLAVVYRKADGEPGCRAHFPPTLRPAAGRNGMTTARAERRPTAAGSHISPPDSEDKLSGAAREPSLIRGSAMVCV